MPSPGSSEYASFIHLWSRVYDEVEPVIDQADRSTCPYKVRVLDSVLWYLGKNEFYNEAEFKR
jgi:hypothetical protein